MISPLPRKTLQDYQVVHFRKGQRKKPDFGNFTGMISIEEIFGVAG
jgi:hypothetical protein